MIVSSSMVCRQSLSQFYCCFPCTFWFGTIKYNCVLVAHLSTMGKGHDLVVEMARHDDDKKDRLEKCGAWNKTAARRIRQARLPHVDLIEILIITFWSLRWSFWCFFIWMLVAVSFPIETGRNLPITPQYPWWIQCSTSCSSHLLSLLIVGQLNHY